jgi:hypothetical protein
MLKRIIKNTITFKHTIMSAKSQLKKEIREAYLFLREKNNTVPSETLEFMLNASLEKVDSLPDVKDFDVEPEKVETLHHLNLTDDEKRFANFVINHYGSGQHPVADEHTFDGFAIEYLKELLNKIGEGPKLSDVAKSLAQSISEKINNYVTK